MQSIKRQIKRGNARIRFEKSDSNPDSATVIFEKKTRNGWAEVKRSKISKS